MNRRYLTAQITSTRGRLLEPSGRARYGNDRTVGVTAHRGNASVKFELQPTLKGNLISYVLSHGRTSTRFLQPEAIRSYGNSARKVTATRERSFRDFSMARSTRKALLPSSTGSPAESLEAHGTAIAIRLNAKWRSAGPSWNGHSGVDRTIVS